MNDTVRFLRLTPINKHLIESLVLQQIYFATPLNLNDPLDCKLNAHTALERALQDSSNAQRALLDKIQTEFKRFIEKYQKDVLKFGIFSGTHELSHHAMWSHYADAHKGVCLRYEFPLELWEDRIIGLTDVEYEDDALFAWLVEGTSKYLGNPPREEQFYIDFMKKYLTAKTSHWKYEKEIRCISHEPGFHSTPPQALKEIYLGIRVPAQDTILLKQLVDAFCPWVELTRMQIEASNFKLVPSNQ